MNQGILWRKTVITPLRHPFGYSNTFDPPAIDGSLAAYVKMIFDRKTEGSLSTPRIAPDLNHAGEKTRNSHKRSKSSAECVLHHPVRIGRVRCVGLIFPEKHSPIISGDEFCKFNSHMNAV